MNLGTEPVTVPGSVLIASEPGITDLLTVDTAAWYVVT